MRIALSRSLSDWLRTALSEVINCCLRERFSQLPTPKDRDASFPEPRKRCQVTGYIRERRGIKWRALELAGAGGELSGTRRAL